jgi:phosphoribosyl 1,2-cyclic phosphodiesterase
MDEGWDEGRGASEWIARLRVLASGSSGNCSLLSCRCGGRVRHGLIDAGISPKRIRTRLESCGVDWSEIEFVLLTHLDSDHAHPGLARAIRRRPGARVLMHERHARRAGPTGLRAEAVAGEFELGDGVRCDATLLPHDGVGVAAFRFEFSSRNEALAGSLGFATDLGRVPPELVERFRGVDVLAIESNYCPNLQHASARPDFLKRRITGGAGHLSNGEALQAIEEIEPREHVVLLHLSRECNHPEIVAEMHAGADYAYTIAEAVRPTRWVPVQGRAAEPRPEPEVHVQGGLFDLLEPTG